MKHKHILLLSCLTVSSMAFGQASLSPYTSNLLNIQKEYSRAEKSKTISAYINVNRNINPTVIADIENIGCIVGCDMGNIITAQIPLHIIEDLQRINGVTYIQAGTPAEQMMNNARLAAGVDIAQAGTELESSYTGEGVIVGVIDTGFDYTHPAFYDSDGTNIRIKRVWEQGSDAGVVAGASIPEPFGYGAEFDTAEEILTASTDLQGNSHGTHVLGIAAGADKADGREYWGVAPDAELVIVSLNKSDRTNVNISDAIAYIYNYANEVGKPCVINMSLGNQLGPHDGTSTFDQMADALQGEGRLLIGSVGNFGGTKLHTSITGKELRTNIDYIKAPSNSNVGGNIDIWAENGTKFTIQLAIVNTTTDEIICQSEVYDASTSGSYTFTPDSPNRGDVLLSTETSPLNGKVHALVTSEITSIRSRNAVMLIITPEGDGTIHVWADGTFVTLSNGDTDYTLAEIGGTGKRITSVGAFVTSHGTGQQYPKDEIGALASFSSRGPSADGRNKPEVLAPGTFIASAFSSYATPTVGSEATKFSWNNRSYSYAYMEGTSMAAPFAAGVAALWLQANPNLTPEDLQSIIAASSSADSKVNAVDGLKNIIASVGLIETSNIPINTVYYDIYGRHVPYPAKGICIKQITYSDGRIKTSKIQNK